MTEDEDQAEEWRGVAASIILLNLFDPSKKGTAAVARAATLRMVRHYLRASTSHLIGVCLYGVEDANTSALTIKSLIEVFPLTAPSLDDFKKLKDIDIPSLVEAKELNMSDVLWHCSKMFTNCKKQLLSRTIVVLTRLDVPPVEADQKPALKRVVDLVDGNIDVKLMNISQDEYNIHTFYEKFLIEANKGGDFIVPRPMWDPQEIEKVMHQQSHRHLAVARLKFEIGNGVAIGVGVYNLLIKSGYSQYKNVHLEAETNTKVALINKTMKVDTTDQSSPMEVDNVEQRPKPLLKSEILYYQTYGDERIVFSVNEKKNLDNPFGQPKMKLLGFKPASVLSKEKWFVKSGKFLFPNDSQIEGSTVAFKALHQACMETGVVAICVMGTRVNARFYLAALLPCKKPLGLDVDLGFDIIQIPLVENVRKMPLITEETQVTDEQRVLMTEIIGTLQFDYKPEMFQNPTVNSKHRAVEAIALQEEDLEPFTDTTKPNQEKFQSLPEAAFEQLFGPFETGQMKRPAPNTQGNKRMKEEVLIDETELNERVQYQTVNKYTVVQLREILKRKGAPDMPPLTSAKKPELVDLVYKYYS